MLAADFEPQTLSDLHVLLRRAFRQPVADVLGVEVQPLAMPGVLLDPLEFQATERGPRRHLMSG